MGIRLSLVGIVDQDRLGEHLLKVDLPEAEECIVIGPQYGIKVNETLVPFADEKSRIGYR